LKWISMMSGFRFQLCQGQGMLMKRSLVLLVIAVMIFFGCSSKAKQEQEEKDTGMDIPHLKVLKKAGCIKDCENEAVKKWEECQKFFETGTGSAESESIDKCLKARIECVKKCKKP